MTFLADIEIRKTGEKLTDFCDFSSYFMKFVKWLTYNFAIGFKLTLLESNLDLILPVHYLAQYFLPRKQQIDENEALNISFYADLNFYTLIL